MSSFLRFTPKEVSLFRRLLSATTFEPGTKEQVARQLDGKHASTSTREFVEKLIDLSCLTYIGPARIKVGSHFEERPIFERDRKRMKDVWMQTEEFKLSFEVLDEDTDILTDDKRLLNWRKGES